MRDRPGGEECSIPLMGALAAKQVSRSEAKDQYVRFLTEARNDQLARASIDI